MKSNNAHCEPVLLYRYVQDLMAELDRVNYLKKSFTDKEAVLKEKRQSLALSWEAAAECKNFDELNALLFVTEFNEYNKILKTDPQEAILEAEYLEKKINYIYGDFLDKKFWNNDALLYISDYLRTGKAKTLEKATELLIKEEPAFVTE